MKPNEIEWGEESGFNERLSTLINCEVSRRALSSTALEFMSPGEQSSEFDECSVEAIGASIVSKLQQCAAGQVTLYLLKFMVDHGMLHYCHDDRCIWQPGTELELKFSEEMDNCG